MVAIKFAEWILQSGYSPVTTAEGMKWNHNRIGSEWLTTVQLYSIFLESRELAGKDIGDKP